MFFISITDAVVFYGDKTIEAQNLVGESTLFSPIC